MRTHTKSLIAVAFFVAATLACSAATLRNATLQVARTNTSQITISWQTKSAVPTPGLQIVPDYQLERSSNLTNWTPFGALRTNAANNQILSTTDSASNTPTFYRVKSIVNRERGHLNQANLSNGELALASFYGIELFAANVTAANLTGADLRAADLRFATMTDAIADGANLFAIDAISAAMDFTSIRNADLSFANLEATDLFGANLRGSDLRSTILTGADLRFTTLHQTLIDSRTKLDSKWIKVWQLVNNQTTNSIFTNLDLSIADLRSANMTNKNFSGSDFSSSSLAGADLRAANLTNANLRFVIFNSALMDTNTIIEAKSRLIWEILNQNAVGRDLHGTNLNNAFLASADMRNVNLTNTTMTLAVMEFANLGGANLTGVNLTSADCVGAIFTNATLNSVNFTSANLTQVNFLGATTNGAIFTGATFSQTIMPDGSIRNF